MLLPSRSSYDEIFRDFEWQIPASFNIGNAVCDAWATREPERVCLQHFDPDGRHAAMTYGELSAQSASLANGLEDLGLGRGDRVALLLPQGFDTVVSHVAIYKIGAIALPLALLFGEEALESRLKAAGAAAVITNGFALSRLQGILPRLPDMRHVIVNDEVPAAPGLLRLDDLIAQYPAVHQTVSTAPDDPALMIFTSGTTGPPKAALHGHRVLAGHVPGFQMGHDLAPQPGDRIWTPADWAWAGGLLNVLLPSLLPPWRFASCLRCRSAMPSFRQQLCGFSSPPATRSSGTSSICEASLRLGKRLDGTPMNGRKRRSGSQSTSFLARRNATSSSAPLLFWGFRGQERLGGRCRGIV
jgi:acetyl-CoA synthetase